MPVTRSRTYLADMGLEDSNNTTGFLFGDEDSNSGETRATPQANASDAFPTFFRQGYSNMVRDAAHSFCRCFFFTHYLSFIFEPIFLGIPGQQCAAWMFLPQRSPSHLGTRCSSFVDSLSPPHSFPCATPRNSRKKNKQPSGVTLECERCLYTACACSVLYHIYSLSLNFHFLVIWCCILLPARISVIFSPSRPQFLRTRPDCGPRTADYGLLLIFCRPRRICLPSARARSMAMEVPALLTLRTIPLRSAARRPFATHSI